MRLKKLGTIILVTSLAGAALSGCGSSESAKRSEQQATESDEGAFVDSGIEDGREGSAGHTSCLIGEWTLDLDDYATQSREWLLSLGAPIDYLDMSGRYTLIFTADKLSIFSHITSDTSILGHPATIATRYEGIGDWFWEADSGPTDISVDHWEFSVPPGDADPDAPQIPSVFDPTLTEAFPVFCAGDNLSIKGPDAPLAGNFTRTG